MNTSSGVRDRPASRAPVVVIQPRFVAQAIGWVVLGLAALLVVERSRHVLELVLLAVVIAVVLRAPIEALSRNLPRWAAVLVVVLASMASVAGLLALGTIQLRQEIDVVGNEVNQRIEEVDPDSALGQFLADANVAERIEEHLDRMPSQILIGSPDPADGARLGLEALLVIVLMLYALINGPGWRAPCSAGATRDGGRATTGGSPAGASQVRRLLALAAVSGLVGLATAYAFGLPGKGVLAIWVGVWAVVPIFGPMVGYAPMVVLASLDGWPQAIGIVLIAGAASVASWYADQRGLSSSRIGGGARTGPLGLAVALVIGLRFGWLTGPLVAIFVMAAAVSTLAAIGRRDSARMLADQPTAVPREPAPGTVWGRLGGVRRAGDGDRGRCRRPDRAHDRSGARSGVGDRRDHVVDRARSARRVDPDHTPLGRGASIGAVIVAWSRSSWRCWCSPCHRWRPTSATSTTNCPRSPPTSSSYR